MRTYLLMFALICIPTFSHAQVVISEIAWMGTDADANNEWIELWNKTSASVSVDGWTIRDGNALAISLSGTVHGNERVILERSDDDTLPGTAFLIYTGALGNGGVTLTVRDASGSVVDQVEGGENWVSIGGLNTIPKETPQRTNNGSWTTAVPTPGTATVEGTQSSESDTEEEVTTTAQNTSASVRTSGGSSSRTNSKKPDEPVVVPDLKLKVEAPGIVYVNQEISFLVHASGLGKTLLNSLQYTWNFGDTYTASGKQTNHVFQYPGEYIVVVHATYASHKETVRHEVRVLPNTMSLTYSDSGDVVLTNESTHEIDLGGYVIQGQKTFTFPQFTILKSNGVLTIPKERVGGSRIDVSLHDTEMVLVARAVSEETALGTVKTKVTQAPKRMGEDAVETKVPERAAVLSTPSSTVIQIGTRTTSEESISLFGRLWRKVTQLF